MDWRLLAGPIIGAIIGYCTNWLAVKMLFRPLYPKYIGKYRLPFTPGIIPKGQQRLARAIGQAVGEQLLTREVMENVLLSDNIKEKILSQFDQLTDIGAQSEIPLKEAAEKLVGKTSLDLSASKLEAYISTRIEKNLREMNAGDIIASRAAAVVKAKVHGTMLALMVTDNLIASITGQVAAAVNDYIDQNAKQIASDVVSKEFDQIMNKPIGEIVSVASDTQINAGEIILSLYEKFVTEKLPDMLNAVDFGGIAQARIEAMDVHQVEELMLSIMKKELGAVVNLGALIGFVLGLFNMFFYH